MPLGSAETPILWIVAGPNGSGKSSVYQDADIEAFARSVWIINPDLLTARIHKIEGLALAASNLQAVERIMAWLKASRYRRSLEQLPWFLEQADQASIYDNSGATPRLIAIKKEGTITLDPKAIPAIVDAVAEIKTS